MELNQVVGIVTGGAAGFGREFAIAILKGKGKVLITDVNVHALQATGKELQDTYGHKNVCWLRQDVCDPDSFHQVFDYAHKYFDLPVNMLANNAGIAGDMTFFDEDAPRRWEAVINIDLTALARGTQVAIQQFRKHLKGKEGVVVNVASVAGLNAVPFGPEYAAAKAGVVGLTRSCYQLKKSDNIRVVAIAPAFAKTAMGHAATESVPEYTKQLPLMEVDNVTNGFVEALREPDNAGRVLRIIERARSYFRFPGDKQLFPNSKL